MSTEQIEDLMRQNSDGNTLNNQSQNQLNTLEDYIDGSISLDKDKDTK